MILIRHAEKQYNNGKSDTYPLDPGITNEGINNAFEKFSILIEKYGIPEQIVCSPFERTRQTALIAQKSILELKQIEVEIVINNKIGEYLGNQLHYNFSDSVKPITYKHKPIKDLSWASFDTRVKKFTFDTPNKNIWIITHGVFIKRFVLHKYNKVVKKIGNLNGIYINKNTIEYI